jgi:aspartyl-tRNA(Asn)/glutamyl-tRNA(Gln) amidotransferase subunit A
VKRKLAWGGILVTDIGRKGDRALHYLGIRELTALIRAKEVSPVEVIDACLARMEDHNSSLNAFVTVLADQARAQAKEAEAEIHAEGWRGPLHGIPVGIKDFYDTAGVKTTAAFEKFKNRVPEQDAVSVAKLKSAGAIVIGKTNMHQLGMGTTGLDSFFGPVRNPWNEAYIPGGSSSGSAAAVAAGMCFATLDTDAIGSCRLPAACCGVVGFKGTFGLVSPKGILEGEQADEIIEWFSHPAVTTRSVADSSLVLEVLADNYRRTEISNAALGATDETELRIGIADDFTADEEVSAAFEAAVVTIQTLGHELMATTAPFEMPDFGDLRTIEPDRRTIADRAFKDIDVIVLPTTATKVIKVKDAAANAQALSAENTIFANYFGLPAISVPCGFDRDGLPVGLQIVGKPWSDSAVLRLALDFQGAVELAAAGPQHPIP